MKLLQIVTLASTALMATGAHERRPQSALVPGVSWNTHAAATYLDGRMAWWLTWRNSARDHETSCISCHTAVPYALARPALRNALGEHEVTASERKMLDNVVKRVRLWNEVEPFYPDQTAGIPKTSESRGTEAVLNALVLSRGDAEKGSLSDDTRQAFANMWQLQFRSGDLKGGWAWLNFQLEPWESTGSPYFGASLAAIAIGAAPGGYASSPEIQDRLKMLRDFLRGGADTTHLFNRIMILWASTQLPALLAPEKRQSIIEAALSSQHEDGGWSIASLGPFRRIDATAPESKSDGYATGLVVLVLQQAGMTGADAHVRRGLEWLVAHQDSSTGMWIASSVNKKRDLATDVGKFMSDAATAYAVLALTQAR
jgi:squalene-hopene/tetraprenyl-beta-curcumene cyclase